LNTGKICQYGKEIKKRLVDIDRSQGWLIEEVKEKTGLFFDGGYLYKILSGQNATPKIVAAINETLGITVPEPEPAAEEIA
jgi:hypothetical protein